MHAATQQPCTRSPASWPACRRPRGSPGRLACSAVSRDDAPGALQQAGLRLAAAAAAALLAVPLPAGAASMAANAPLPALPPAPFDIEQTKESKLLFDPMAYSGRWYEVASLKRGFAGEGQQDCHCTQGIYTPNTEGPEGGIKLEVDTFCFHGGPDGRLSGIKGSVSCADPLLLSILPEFQTEMDTMEGFVAKCALRFDSLAFLPPEPYLVLRTDYKSYALVRGAKDRSFVQIYSRTPNPGAKFIAEQKAVLAQLGYPAADIVDTPQDCPEMAPQAMMAAMNRGMASTPLMPASTPPVQAMAGYDLGPAAVVLGGEAPAPAKGITFDRLRNPLESLKNVLTLFD